MAWFSRVITTYPLVILGVISVTCIVTFYVSFHDRKLPDFEDPQLGFETRGTQISQRLVAWDKLMDESKPYGSLTMDPSELLPKTGIPISKRAAVRETPDRVILRTSRDREEEEDDDEDNDNDENNEETKKNCAKKKNKERWEQLKQIQFPKRDEIRPHDEQYKKIYRYSYDTNFFCDTLQPGYAQIVLSAKSTGVENLFTYEAISSICEYQTVLESLPNYMRACITSESGGCCNMWSLPNYISWLMKLPSCKQITVKEINSTLSVLKSCWKYYVEGKLSPSFNGKEPPPRLCSQNSDVYNIMHYIVDVDFLPNEGKDIVLKDTSVYLPIPKSSASLQLFHDVEDLSFTSQYFKITAMDLGLKYSLFNEYLLHDIRYILLSSIFIVFCMWIYTGCAFVTILTITAIFFSLVNAYFIYTFVFGLHFFPFMNILAIIVSLGIGSDDAYIMCKVWDRTKKENSHLSKNEVVQLVIKHSAVAVFVTTLTTVAAFLSSYWSSVTAVRCFSIFAGLSVLLNFAFMITWILSGIVISSEWPYIPLIHWSFSRDADVIYENILNVKSTFDHCIAYCVEQYHVPLMAVLGFVSVLSTFSVLCWPKLQVPDSSEFQLFERKHPFEQYDLIFQDRFRFSHVFSEENIDQKLPLRFVWGILPTDTGNYLDPLSRGKLHMDPKFDLASNDSQEWLFRFCRRLRMQPFYQATMGPTLSNCFIETFKKWMDRECVDPIDGTNRYPCCDKVPFPYPRRVFNVCVVKAMASLYRVDSFLASDVAGPRFSKNVSMKKIPKIKAVIVEFNSNMSFTTSFEAMNTFYQQVDTWSRTEFSTAPPGLKNGWFVTYLAFYDLQRTLTQDTAISILISMFVALVVLFVVTINVPLSLVAILTITCIIFVSVSALIVLGWKLNILESIAISVAIGLSVDFSLHYAVNYKLCMDKTNRKTCVVHALSMMATPSLMAAITTGAAGLFMLPSVVLPYIQIGIFLIVVSVVSWIYATFFQMSILYRYGPQNDYGQFSFPTKDALIRVLREWFVRNPSAGGKWFRSLFRRCQTSNPMYSVHEMENLSKIKKPDNERHRSESFSHFNAPSRMTRSTRRLSYSLEQIPSGASSVTFIHDDECDRNNMNT
ncbi:protein dispatched isoform X2 [Planococcus citri]